MSSMVLDGGMPRSRTSDPVTSVDAGRAADLNTSQEYVLGLLRHYGPRADFELEDLAAADIGRRKARGLRAWSASRIRSARKELVDAGLVEPTGEKRPTLFGKEGFVHRAVTASG